jgi:subtilisin family serine protease
MHSVLATGRRILPALVLILCLTVQAGAASYPVIVQVPALSSITAIAAALGGTVLDSIPGANTYLLRIPFLPSSLTVSLLGIQILEVNQGVTQPGFFQFGIVNVPATNASDWYKYQPSLTLIRSREALAYSKGRGVVVADLNSIVDVAHPGLIGHLTTGYDFVTSNPSGETAMNQSSASFMDQSSSSFMDQSSASFMDTFSAALLNQSSSSFMDGVNPAYSHGTLCAGVIAVIAPESMIMPLRVFDENGSADIFTIAKAIRYAVDHGANVINMSFGTLQNSPTLNSAVTYALGKKVVLVASAGNNNTSAPQYPAAYSGVITTAATDLSDKKASFSNYGPSVFVDAPGVHIFSTYPGGAYSVVNGTSFSAPMVAGTAALIRSLQANGVAGDIAAGALDIDSKNPGYSNKLGYGRIDVLKSVTTN